MKSQSNSQGWRHLRLGGMKWSRFRPEENGQHSPNAGAESTHRSGLLEDSSGGHSIAEKDAADEKATRPLLMEAEGIPETSGARQQNQQAESHAGIEDAEKTTELIARQVGQMPNYQHIVLFGSAQQSTSSSFALMNVLSL